MGCRAVPAVIRAGAVTMGTIAATSSALKLAFAALRIAGVQAFTGIAASVRLSTAAIEKMLAVSSAAAPKVAALGKMALAGWVGWNLGTWAREQFLSVELAGIKLAKTFAEIKIRLENLFVFSGDAYEQYVKELTSTLKIYEDMEEAARKAHGEAGSAAQEQAQQTTEAANQTKESASGAVDAVKSLRAALSGAGEAGEDAGKLKFKRM